MGVKIPTFTCSQTLLGYYPDPDLNRIKLYGPGNFEFVLYEIGEDRGADANARCNRLAAKLTELWDAQTDRDDKGS